MSKAAKYLKYLVQHKYRVMKTCFDFGLYRQGIIHDLSKFHPVEWFPYQNSFYGKRTPEVRKAFDRAWLRHQRINKHHWQYWVVLRDDKTPQPLEMPIDYAIEMICDWYAAGGAKSWAEPIDWMGRQNGMLLHPQTRSFVVEMLNFKLRSEKNRTEVEET